MGEVANDMIERVARALAHSDGCTMVGNSQSKATREFGWDGSNINAMNKYVEAHWPQFKHAAGFAIGAMREPTEAMMNSACDIGPDTNSGEFSWDNATQVYHAMIDEALK